MVDEDGVTTTSVLPVLSALSVLYDLGAGAPVLSGAFILEVGVLVFSGVPVLEIGEPLLLSVLPVLSVLSVLPVLSVLSVFPMLP